MKENINKEEIIKKVAEEFKILNPSIIDVDDNGNAKILGVTPEKYTETMDSKGNHCTGF